MPARYEAIRDSLVKKGMPLAEAKGHAARIFNASRKPGVAPVTGSAEAPKKRVGVKRS
jgi:hypothetical protein